MSARILIVEDDENLRLGLEDSLDMQGYAVQSAADGAAARAAIEAAVGADAPHEVIILDIMLPDTDGYTLCRELRAAGHPAMVLMLTARTLEEDLVRGFDEGADDYLAKPYRLRELLARISALLRRAQGKASVGSHEVVNFGPHRLDLTARDLSGPGGERIELTRTEFDLLHCFLRHRDTALTRDQLLDEVWGQDVIVEGRTVDNFVYNLKKKLGWHEALPWRIRAVRGVGYRMEIDAE